MKVINQITLKFLAIVVFIGEIMMLISGAGTLATGIVKLINPKQVHMNVEIYNLQLTSKFWHQNLIGSIGLLILSVLLAMSLAVGLDSMRKIILNIERQQYFSLANLRAIRWILGASSSVLIIECILQIYAKYQHLLVTSNNIWLLLIVTGMIYVIEQLFVQGLQLQTDMILLFR